MVIYDSGWEARDLFKVRREDRCEERLGDFVSRVVEETLEGRDEDASVLMEGRDEDVTGRDKDVEIVREDEDASVLMFGRDGYVAGRNGDASVLMEGRVSIDGRTG
ncbi:hypothetical protein T484DRAFT_1765781 [Baffinella frigidus]|nr:hypothetical protein T484DRAFT_1765781 [Cryptophyta sp. CCMP2293]